MWRTFFCAIGLAALILGGEFLVIDRATLKMPAEKEVQQLPLLSGMHDAVYTKDFVPPEWAPWSLLFVGAVVVLYSNNVAKQ